MTRQPSLTCRDENRRQAIRDTKRNGIDYVEIANAQQTELRVHLFHAAPKSIKEITAVIEGGQRIRKIEVTNLWIKQGEPDCLRVTVKQAGDFSTYTLRLVAAEGGKSTGTPPSNFDPRYANI